MSQILQTSPPDTAESTTFVVGGTTYTALGGKKGFDHTVSDTGNGHSLGGAQSSSMGGTDTTFRAENRYPGSGGGRLGTVVYSVTTLLVDTSTDTWTETVRARAEARSGRGQDGMTEVFQVTVVPSTVYSFTIGAGAGYVDTTYETMGSNGAIIIEYVV